RSAGRLPSCLLRCELTLGTSSLHCARRDRRISFFGAYFRFPWCPASVARRRIARGSRSVPVIRERPRPSSLIPSETALAAGPAHFVFWARFPHPPSVKEDQPMTAQASGEAVTGKLAGWLKGLVTTVLGLCSGAVLMYASPLIDRVVKPAKPVANFAAQLE